VVSPSLFLSLSRSLSHTHTHVHSLTVLYRSGILNLRIQRQITSACFHKSHKTPLKTRFFILWPCLRGFFTLIHFFTKTSINYRKGWLICHQCLYCSRRGSRDVTSHNCKQAISGAQKKAKTLFFAYRP
jgi:hypothetical protein